MINGEPASLACNSLRFDPYLLDSLRDYDRAKFVKDLSAGVTVGIVALPLAMAFGIASGAKPEQGIFTAIIAGFLISALGGSRVQIGGPAGAFVVIIYGIIAKYGFANLLISTMCAGVLLFAMGLTRLGSLVRFIPVSIVIGFTNGIAVLIIAVAAEGLSRAFDRAHACGFFSASAVDRALAWHDQSVRGGDRGGIARHHGVLATTVARRQSCDSGGSASSGTCRARSSR